MIPAVSIIVPVYNVKLYLSDCLKSISAQTFPGQREVILVNDGSTDGSDSICNAFCKEHPEAILIEQENKGLSEARNTGIAAARGKWLLFLDSDDKLAPDALATLTDYAENQECDMVVGGFYYDYNSYLLYDDRWFHNQKPFSLERSEAMKQLILQRYLKNFAWGKLYLTETVKRHLFRPGVFFEDSYWQHWMIDDAARVGIIPKPLYYYKQRKESISGSFSKNNLDLLIGTAERLSFIRERYSSLAPLQEKCFERLVQSFLDSANASGDQETIHAFSSFAEEHGIKPSPRLSKVVRSIYAHLFERRPTILNKK
jgi:glycosyltransferase involved in cell wall biosynthesis